MPRRLFLTHVQDQSIAPEGVALDHDGVVGMIVGAGRPIKLSFSDVSPAAPAATARPSPSVPLGTLRYPFVWQNGY